MSEKKEGMFWQYFKSAKDSETASKLGVKPEIGAGGLKKFVMRNSQTANPHNGSSIAVPQSAGPAILTAATAPRASSVSRPQSVNKLDKQIEETVAKLEGTGLVHFNGVLIDNSGSMDHKGQEIIDGVKLFHDELMKSSARYSIVFDLQHLNDRSGDLYCPLTEFRADSYKGSRLTGDTPLFRRFSEMLDRVAHHLDAAMKQASRYSVLLSVMTDGGNNVYDVSEEELAEKIKAVRESNMGKIHLAFVGLDRSYRPEDRKSFENSGFYQLARRLNFDPDWILIANPDSAEQFRSVFETLSSASSRVSEGKKASLHEKQADRGDS